MRVVFMEEVEGTARVGEVKNVADGFARNYLLPRKLAAPATDHYIGIATARAEKEARRESRLDEEAREHLVPKMEGRSITIEVRVGEQGKLFGSVTSRDIAEQLQALTGVELEHRQIGLKQPIRDVGVHEVAVNLTRNVPVTVIVNVEPLGGMPEVAEGEEAPEGEEAGAAAGPEAGTEEPQAEVAEEPTEEPAAAEEPAEEPVVEEEEAPVAAPEPEAVVEGPAAEEPVEEEAEDAVAEQPVTEEPAAEEKPEPEGEPAAEETEAEQAEGEEEK
ncbi:MAG: 50S ribosomal protein L9 [Dehalococcoidia bacterium]